MGRDGGEKDGVRVGRGREEHPTFATAMVCLISCK